VTRAANAASKNSVTFVTLFSTMRSGLTLASTEHVQQQQEDAQFVQALVRRVGADPAFAVTMRRVHDQLEHLFDNL